MPPPIPILCVATILLACGIAPLQAASPTEGKATYPAFAEVVHARKLTRREQQSQPIKRCNWEQLPDRVRYNQRYGERRVLERRVKRCRTVNQTRVVEQVIGYDVTLRYNGEVFTRRLATHPGVRIPVSVEIEPITSPESAEAFSTGSDSSF